MSSLVSVNVGLPHEVEWQGRVVRTGIWKRPVTGRVMARRLNLDGDGQGDLAGHGGEQRAVMVYQIDSYRYWQTFLKRNDFEYGQFGENLTVDGLPDDEVCIGDRYRIGGALFEVTQPRVTCYRVGLRMNNPEMPALLVSHHRPGFYCRVIEEGEIGAGDQIIKEADGPERITVAQIDALLYLPGHRPDLLKRALQIPALSVGWKQSFDALLGAEGNTERGGNAGLVSSIEPAPAWRGFRTLRVQGITLESADVRSFVLESEDRSPLPSAQPGQFLVMRLRPGNGSAPVLRSYSMSGEPGLGTYRISVKRTDGVGSRYLHDCVKVGDMLDTSAPRGSFTLTAGTRPVVLLSAGIGATPVLSMLHWLAADPTRASRGLWWFYGARNGSEHPFAAEARQLLARLPGAHALIAYSRPSPADQQGRDYDTTGHLDIPLLNRLEVPKEAEFYLCGPTGFLADITNALKAWGVSGSCVHVEIFGAGPSITPGIARVASGTPHQPAGSPGAGPNVSFTRSGLLVPWSDRFESLLDLAEACDVPVRWSCRTGVCHTCESGLIGGNLRYRPEPLEKPADGSALICCSKPLSDVELDL